MHAIALESERSDRDTTVSWWVLGVAGVAYLAVAVGGGQAPLMGVLGLALILTKLTPARLARGSWTAWLLRVPIFGGIVFLNVVVPDIHYGHGLYSSAVVTAVAELLSAELAVQAWRERPAGGRRGPAILFLSGVVLLLACNTFDYRWLRWLVPLYALMAIPALRSLRMRKTDTGGLSRRAWLARGAALTLALSIGGGTYLSLWAYRAEISRLGRDLLSGWQRRSIGLTGSPRLGDRMSLERSLTRMLRLEGPIETTHLRAASFETYLAGRWLPPLQELELIPTDISELSVTGQHSQVQVTRLVDELAFLPAPLHCAEVRPTRTRQVQRGLRDPGLLRLTMPAPYTYTFAFSNDANHQGPLAPPIDTERRSLCLAVPEGLDGRLYALARTIFAGKQDTREKIAAVIGHLAAHHKYSLNADRMHGDPVVTFLLEGKDGHCEYFASAAVLLLRLGRIPARYTMGFYAHERDGDGMLVRQQDAHAWAEAWVEGTGWVTVEATPGGGLPDQIAQAPSWARRLYEHLHDLILAFGDWWMNLSWLQIGLTFGVIAALVITYLWLREWLARRWAALKVVRRSYTPADESLRPLGARFERWLKRRGFPCPEARPWSEHLELLAREPDALRRVKAEDWESARAFTETYARARFGRSSESLKDLQDRLRRMGG
ncbi:MAG: transglutaminase domain-containing protein [Planctomycetes bacterium]|nr:transglutaminase domain-containing protein [Planctomycetota bacterium]